KSFQQTISGSDTAVIRALSIYRLSPQANLDFIFPALKNCVALAKKTGHSAALIYNFLLIVRALISKIHL
ncbi:MAG TPA: hypothetical protein DCS33_07365, partial [Gammaproteobacteria bacterium]|nr:hypothetical protein [Gammaproteobacteria bacterium]